MNGFFVKYLAALSSKNRSGSNSSAKERSVLDHHNRSTQAKLTIRSPKIRTPVHQENRIDKTIMHELGKGSCSLRTLYHVLAGTYIGASVWSGDERSTGFVAVLIPKFYFLCSPQTRSTYRLLTWLVFIHGQRCFMSNPNVKPEKLTPADTASEPLLSVLVISQPKRLPRTIEKCS